VLHLARFADAGEVAGHLEVFQTQHEDSPPAELA
jgi:hypothetical protein